MALKQELQALFSKQRISENGFYVRREQVFRGKTLRFGGYGSKYMLKLFRRSAGRLDPDETDTRVYVQGDVGKLSSPIVEDNLKENDILFYLQKHLRYAEVFAQEEAQRRREGFVWKTSPAFFGTPDQRVLWLKRLYFPFAVIRKAIHLFFLSILYPVGFPRWKTGERVSFFTGLLVQVGMGHPPGRNIESLEHGSRRYEYSQKQ